MAETFFKPHGSLDDDNVKVTGKEFWKIMKYFNRKWLLVSAILLAMIAGASPLVMNFFMGDLMNTLGKPNFTNAELNSAIVKVIYCVLALNLIMVINFSLRAFSNPEFMHDLRYYLYKQLMRQDISYFDKTPTGILIGRLSQDVTLLFQIYIDKMLMAVQDLTQAFGGLVLSFVVMWHVALPVTGIIILCAIIYYIGDKIIDKLWDEFNKNSSTATSKAEEVITSFRTIKSFDNEMKEAKLYGEALDSVDAVFHKTSIAQGIKDASIWVLIHLMIAGFLYLASYFIIDRPDMGYQSGDILILILSLIFSAIGISLCLSLSDDFKKARVSAAKVLKILELEPEVDQEQGGKELKEVQGRIEFKNVGFRYKTREDWAVRNLSFVVEPGQTVALIGESGCGKSTTLQLIQRFYEIQEGQILIDGVDIQTLNPKYLRSLISIVPQGPVLFSMSVKDNIRFSKSKATDDEIAEAARIGNAHNFIMEMPDNYESKVQQTSLSGGQKQRICISRAILANAPILLLDEATAALDTESEQLVQQSLETFRHGKTAILVAHRLATVIHADRILVFKDGHVAEEGTHKDLMAKNGLYADLVKYQLQ
ncbi:ABC transporter family protein [Tritrichomonas foetus]|uniref:ABC transporter family protein n=1 Tax=Tritrichomonas foetus TaxID=1144522 RepID=A0A1J4JSK8_9EUKA|nr:ABC transporter family protein [Tritrichomonas foetus]|eukprot:OHT02035.1 ABC transporter family protein [Tritrichomonas foetus]